MNIAVGIVQGQIVVSVPSSCFLREGIPTGTGTATGHQDAWCVGAEVVGAFEKAARASFVAVRSWPRDRAISIETNDDGAKNKNKGGRAGGVPESLDPDECHVRFLSPQCAALFAMGGSVFHAVAEKIMGHRASQVAGGTRAEEMCATDDGDRDDSARFGRSSEAVARESIDSDVFPGGHAHRVARGLWVGDAISAGDHRSLRSAGITHIVDCIADHADPGPAVGRAYPLQYHRIRGVQDIPDARNGARLAACFDACVFFVASALGWLSPRSGDAAREPRREEPGNEVLIHCAAGVSRSATIAAVCLAARSVLTRTDDPFTHGDPASIITHAIAEIAAHRPLAEPNPAFRIGAEAWIASVARRSRSSHVATARCRKCNAILAAEDDVAVPLLLLQDHDGCHRRGRDSSGAQDDRRGDRTAGEAEDSCLMGGDFSLAANDAPAWLRRSFRGLEEAPVAGDPIPCACGAKVGRVSHHESMTAVTIHASRVDIRSIPQTIPSMFGSQE